MKKETEEIEKSDFQVVEGELLEVSNGSEIEEFSDEEITAISKKTKDRKLKTENQKSYLQYIFLPLIFLTVALLGGWRIDAARESNAFVFLKPPLVCLIFAALLLVLFFRANLIRLEGWFSERFSILKNIANGAVLVTLFFASAQIFNSLLPEQGLPFWVFAFCFFWTLWNNLFADFDARKLLKSLGAIFGLAFVIKYLILSSLTAPAGASWWQGILENPMKEAFTWALNLPRFAAATGYIQFFGVIFYLIGLFLLPPVSTRNE